MRLPNYNLLELTPEQLNMIYYVEYYSEPFLIFLSRNIPNYTSHGIDHTMHILDNLYEFLTNWKVKLTQDELMLLCLAAWLHDIGCIKDRENHHIESVNIFLDNQDLINTISPRYAICLKHIVLAHRTRYPIENVPETYGKIRLRFISAIFRLMDACEICYPKCPKQVYMIIKDSLNEVENGFWVAHMNILSLKFTKPEIKISVNDIKKCQKIIDDVKYEVSTIKNIFLENSLPEPQIITI